MGLAWHKTPSSQLVRVAHSQSGSLARWIAACCSLLAARWGTLGIVQKQARPKGTSGVNNCRDYVRTHTIAPQASNDQGKRPTRPRCTPSHTLLIALAHAHHGPVTVVPRPALSKHMLDIQMLHVHAMTITLSERGNRRTSHD